MDPVSRSGWEDDEYEVESRVEREQSVRALDLVDFEVSVFIRLIDIVSGTLPRTLFNAIN